MRAPAGTPGTRSPDIWEPARSAAGLGRGPDSVVAADSAGEKSSPPLLPGPLLPPDALERMVATIARGHHRWSGVRAESPRGHVVERGTSGRPIAGSFVLLGTGSRTAPKTPRPRLREFTPGGVAVARVELVNATRSHRAPVSEAVR